MLTAILPDTPPSLTVRAAPTSTRMTVPDIANATSSDMTVLTVNGTPGVRPGRNEVDTWCQKDLEDDRRA